MTAYTLIKVSYFREYDFLDLCHENIVCREKLSIYVCFFQKTVYICIMVVKPEGK